MLCHHILQASIATVIGDFAVLLDGLEEEKQQAEKVTTLVRNGSHPLSQTRRRNTLATTKAA